MKRGIRFLAWVVALACGLLANGLAFAEAGEGYLLEKVQHYDAEGKAGMYDAYEYDGNGYLVKKTVGYSSGWVDHWFEYKNDAEGRMLRETMYNEDGACTSRVFEYDDAGNMIRKTEHGKDGSEGFTYHYEYDEGGRVTRFTRVSSRGELSLVADYAYDEAGNRIHYVEKDADGVVVTEFSYDYQLREDGLPTRATTYNGEGGVHRVRDYEYDEHGNRIRETVYDARDLAGSIEYSYMPFEAH